VLLGYPYTPAPHTGRGIDEYLFLLAQGLQRRGVPFRFVEAGRPASDLQQMALGEPRILSRVARTRGGFWHAVSPVGARVAVTLGRRPLVTTVHDVMPFYMLNRHPARYRFLRFCIELTCRRSDHLIVPFPSVQQFLIDRLGVPEERVSLVPYGVDPAEAGLANVSSAPPNPPHSETVLFFGSWNPIDRGADLMLRAMGVLLRERPQARLGLSCKGPQTETVRRISRELGVDHAVDFLGFVPGPKLGETLRSAAAVVFPSRLSFNLLEMLAMHAGVPIVATDVRDQSYFVGDAGIICPAEDAETLGAQLGRLLADERLRFELVERGRARIRQFSTERMIEGTLQAYVAAGWAGNP